MGKGRHEAKSRAAHRKHEIDRPWRAPRGFLYPTEARKFFTIQSSKGDNQFPKSRKLISELLSFANKPGIFQKFHSNFIKLNFIIIKKCNYFSTSLLGELSLCCPIQTHMVSKLAMQLLLMQ